MTNQIAIFLALVIVALIGMDFALFYGDGTLFLAKKFIELTEWMAFWR